MEAELLTNLFGGADLDIDVNVKPKERTGGKNCAAYMEKPEFPRNSSNFVGLYNQGGTCYMNSLIQSLFMNPLFRNAIYSIPLCTTDITQLTGQIKGQKFNVLLALQMLLVELESYNIRAITTKNLTNSLGWESSEGRDQHDVQELNRILFDLLERALFGTPYDGLIADLYKGVYFQQTSCSKCFNGNRTEAEFLDLILQVKDFTRVEDSLNAYFGTEVINDYKCEICNEKLDLHKFQKLKRAPPLLTLALFRIGYDFAKDERFKLNSRMEFPLELDLTEFFDSEYQKKEDNKYELYSVIVHRGNANQGHYFSYTRDLLGEGNFDLKPLVEFRKEPLMVEKVEKEEEEKKMEQAEKTNNEVKDNKKNKGNKNNNKQANNKRDDNIQNAKKQEEKKQNDQNPQEEKKNTKKDKQQNQAQQQKNPKHQNQKQKNTQPENNQPSKKQVKKQDEEHSRFNYDECDHPIKYSNQDLSRNWFCFDDTSIGPIRVGRLQKQFQSSESAYILMYIKKGMKFEKPSPPNYLKKYIDDENTRLFEGRSKYEEEEGSLIVHLFEPSNFFVDEFGILTVRPGIDVEKTEDKFNSKVKFASKLEGLLTEIKNYYESKHKKETALSDILLFDILPRNNTIIILSQIDVSSHEATLEALKFAHEGAYLIINKSNPEIVDSYIIQDLDAIGKQVGSDYEPVEINIVNGSVERKVKTFSKTTLVEFKDFLKVFFKIDFKFDLTFQSGNKIINIDHISFDKKTNKCLSVKQLKLAEKPHIFISVSILLKRQNLDAGDRKLDANSEEKINVIVKFEDSDESKIISKIVFNQVIRLNKTFEDLFNKIRKKLEIDGEFRLRRLINGNIINKDELVKKLSSDDDFAEGGVRLQVEPGESYTKNEILVKMLVEVGQEKLYKEFIGAETTTLSQLKSFICKELNLKPEEYTVSKTSYLKDPIKVYKTETDTLKKLGIKDANLIYFENIAQQLYEKYLLRFFLPNEESKNDLTFVPINIETNQPILELTMEKDQILSEIKASVIEALLLNSTQKKLYTIHNIRLRVISKKGEAERILRGNSNPIKKLRLDNPTSLLIEVLDEPEDLNDNTIQLYVYLRDTKKTTYTGKKYFVFSFESTASSTGLYMQLRTILKLDNITIAKHSKSYYNWEIIPETEDEQPINLKKSYYSLKDGDWIGVRNDDVENAENDDMQTEEDKKMLEIYKKINQTNEISIGKKSRVAEKPLRFKMEF